jgi:polyhydroxybutyrate depolymerase
LPPATTPIEVERAVLPTYDGTTPRPLIVDLHGFTSTIEQQNLFSDLPAQAADRGYLVLTPQAESATLTISGEQIRAPFWNVSQGLSAEVPDALDDVAFLTQLIDTTTSEFCVDDARIYVTGFSNGAGMAATLACDLPGRIAAIAPVSGVNVAAQCDDLEAVSVIAFHGDADPLVEYGGGSAAGVDIGNPSVEGGR